MITSIKNGLTAEFIKSKGSFSFWFTLISAILIPFVNFLIYIFRFEYLIPDDGANIWNNFIINSNLASVSILLLPFYIVLSVALNLNIEHKSDSWKKILLLPVSRASIYFSKVLFILIQIFFALLIFIISIFIFGLILGLIHPKLMFFEHSIDILLYLKLILLLFVSILGIFSIQYVISLFFSNIIIPIASGTFLIIVALIITSKWEYSVYFPYSFSSLFYYDYVEKINVEKWYGISMTAVLSFAIFSLALFIGLQFFKKKEFK